MTIQNSELTDIDTIFHLYDEATKHQKKVAEKHWQGFDRSLIEQEIEEKRQWKIIVDGHIACVFPLLLMTSTFGAKKTMTHLFIFIG
jgi:hypothetical protein